MYGTSATVAGIVEKKVSEVLSRPEVQKEIESAVEAGVLGELPESIKKMAKANIDRWDTPLRESVQKSVERWLGAHADEIQALADAAAEKAVQETGIFEDVARRQFTHFLSGLAEKAIEKAAAKRDRAEKRKAKKAA